MNPQIYREYTGENNDQVITNLTLIKQRVPSNRYAIKVPILPGHADENSQQDSICKLKELGINEEMIVPFTYII